MRGLPAAARGYIGCAALAAALCAAPAAGLGADAPWSSALALATLYGLCEQLRRCPPPGGRVPYGTASGASGGFPAGWASPVLLAGAFLLPPPLAALAAVPGALSAPAEPRFAAARRVWHAAELGPACWAAAQVFRSFGQHPLSAPQFPLVLLPAAAAAATFCAVLAVLDGGVLATAERHPVRTAWRGLLARSLGPQLVHGLAGLMMAVLWRSSYGPCGGAAGAAADVPLQLGLRPVPPGTRRPSGHHPRPRPGRGHQGPLHPRAQRAGRARLGDDRPGAGPAGGPDGGAAVHAASCTTSANSASPPGCCARTGR